jgi:hypothetical protein
MIFSFANGLRKQARGTVRAGSTGTGASAGRFGPAQQGEPKMARFFRDNGLTIVLMLLFLGSIVGQWIAGWIAENDELARHGGATLTLSGYLVDPNFVSAVFENWESEFLQMSAYVVLTAILFQRGSAESNDPDQKTEREGDRVGRGLGRWIYAHSLGLALFVLFLMSFLIHWVSSADAAAEEALRHGDDPVGRLEYLGDAQLWFESFQNWQSEFLSTALLVVLSIFLRQRGSPESKPVQAPHSETGA